MATTNLTRSNRAVGLMNELADLIADEDSALELWRIQKTLVALSQEARTRSQLVDETTRELTRASNKRRARKPVSFGARVAAFAARA